jgi:hypothetical protein
MLYCTYNLLNMFRTLICPSSTGGGRLCVRWGTFGFHQMWGISWLAEDRLASQEGLCCMEWISK